MTPRNSLFIRWTIHRPVTILVAFVAFLVIGVVAYPRIAVQLLPPGISSGAVAVWIPVPDGTPEEVMEQVAKPAEDLLRTIPGVKEILSISGARRCLLRVEYDPAVGVETITADVRERIDRARLRWPDGVDRYNLWRAGMGGDVPIYIASVGIEADDESVDVNEVFETVLQNRLLAVDGVARVTFWGLVEKRATIDLDNDRVNAHAVPVRRLIERLGADNVNVTCGKIREGDREFLVRSIGKFRSFDEIREYPVTRELRISDVADVGYYRAIRDRLSRVNGLFSKVVVVQKDSLANTIEVCGRVRQIMEHDIRERLPQWYPGIHQVDVHTFMNQGEVIELSIGSLRRNGAWGGLLAMAVLFVFFRRLRITLLVTLAIPFSLLLTVVWIYFRGGTFNILSLTGMSLGIGMLVDNSIVVVENIVRKRDAGMSVHVAVIEGVREVGLAVSLATLTTVVVFLPIMFMADPRFSTIYREVGGPLCVSVLASLLVALVFVPQGAIFLYRRGLTRSEARGEQRPRAARSADPGQQVSGANRATVATLHWCLRHRFEALVLFGIVFSSIFLVFDRTKKNDTVVEGRNRVELQVKLPRGLNLTEAVEVFDRLEGALNEHRDEFDIQSITTWFGSRDGELNIFFTPGKRVQGAEFFRQVEPLLPRIPDVEVNLAGGAFDEDRWGDRVRVFIQGNDLGKLDRLAKEVEAVLKDRVAFAELSDVNEMREDEQDEVRVTVRRSSAQHYGINAQSVSSMVSWAIRGALLPDYETAKRELPFWIRFQDADKESLQDLRMIPVYRPDGLPVPLDTVADYAVYPGPGDIERLNGKITLVYSAAAETEDLRALKMRVRRRLEKIPVPEGFELTTDRRREGFDVDFEMSILAAILALSLVFFVMGVLFESFILPFSIILSIPQAFFGSIWALFLSGVALDSGGMVGMIMLVGIVVNNAIVLVDSINRRRIDGMERTAAVLEAARIRFRPVWMTALTTIFGLVPLAVLPQTGEGMDYKSMAVVLIGGLSTSTFFTLFVVPLFYTLLDDLREVATRVLHYKASGVSTVH